MKYAIYEIWTRHRVVEAVSVQDALDKFEPEEMTSGANLELSNWHAVPIDDLTAEGRTCGGLNYRQIERDDRPENEG